MHYSAHYAVVDAHSAGAQARVVVGGVAPVRGDTMEARRQFMQREMDHIRKLLMYEPRGGAQMSGSIIMEPCDPRADIGLIFIETGGWLTMCGAGTIGAATVMVETGLIPAVEPVTRIVIDTPAGLVTAQVAVRDGTVTGVRLENVPSYLALRDQRVTLADHGEVDFDVAFGGNFYAIVPADRFGLQIIPDHGADLVRVGRALRDAANAAISVRHPLQDQARPIPNVILTGRNPATGAHANMVLFGENAIDRSPGGTGTSARMAQLHARGELALNEPFVHESIVGSRFVGTLTGTVQVADQQMVTPVIEGRAFIIAQRNMVLDPQDSFPEGFGVGYAFDALRPVHQLGKDSQ